MIRYLKRRAAIGSYFWRLSKSLNQRFGKKSHYSIEEVTKTAKEGDFNIAFVAYAHAMFCRRDEFEAYYQPLHVACTYDGLRHPIASRFFNGSMSFDATNILVRSEFPLDREYDFKDSAPLP